MDRCDAVKITADTNVLVRSAVQDDKRQAAIADRILKNAERVVVPLPCLCEFVWVLLSVYDFSKADVAVALKALLAVGKVEVDRAGVQAGITILNAGGDFADGVIAYLGQHAGSDCLVSFDHKTVRLVGKSGISSRLAR